MLVKAWTLTKDTVAGFLANDALSRGAAIAYFTIFLLAPLLIVVTASPVSYSATRRRNRQSSPSSAA